MTSGNMFDRLQILIGSEAQQRLARTRVAVFGLGGVGGWAAEGLCRSGVGHLTLVDSDVVDITNLNRQVQTHQGNLGRPKAEELRQRLLGIAPQAEIAVVREFYTAENAEEFHLASFDFVLDCIDSVPSKADLIIRASAAGATVYSSMGAAFKLDPTLIRSDSLWKTEGCALARVIRRRLRDLGFAGDVQAVFSPETVAVTDRSVNGSAVFVTACFGLTLAGMVVRTVADCR